MKTRTALAMVLGLGVLASCSDAVPASAPASTTPAATTPPTNAPTATTPPTNAPTATTPPTNAPTATTPPTNAPTATTPPTNAPATTTPCRYAEPYPEVIYTNNDPVPTSRRGDCGPGVTQIQERLVYRGYDDRIPGFAVDGIFGPLTEQAVRDWQGSVGLEVDGIVGFYTWLSLLDDGT